MEIAPNYIPCWYKAVAVVISLYQAYRGFMFQWIFGVDIKGGKLRRVMVLCLADMFTYFVCAASGFVALYWASFLVSANDTLTISLLLYAILGITGKLPDLLHKIGFPPQK